MSGYERVFVVDAAQSGGCPGTVTMFDIPGHKLPVRYFSCSTHAFGLAEAIEVARTIGRLPSRLTVFAIEGERFDAGDPISESVLMGVESVVHRIRSRLGEAAPHDNR